MLTFNVVVCIASFDLITGGTHCELVNTHVTGPAVSNVNFPVQNFSLRFFQQEGIEVILHRFEVGTWFVANSGKQNGVLRITIGHNS